MSLVLRVLQNRTGYRFTVQVMQEFASECTLAIKGARSLFLTSDQDYRYEKRKD